jgi:hypothetical protein
MLANLSHIFTIEGVWRSGHKAGYASKNLKKTLRLTSDKTLDHPDGSTDISPKITVS